MKVCIVDDSNESVETIKSYLHRYGQENNISFAIDTFDNGFDFIENYRPQYKFILLDIAMPKMNGLDTAARLRQIDQITPLLFITYMCEYAINGYNYNACGFIVKPILYQQLKLAVDRAIKQAKMNDKKECLLFSTKEGMIKVPVDEIIFADVIGHTLTIHTINGDYIVKDTLSSLAKQTQKYYFIQCHVCYLLNPKYITSTTKEFFYIDKMQFPVSRLRKKANMGTLMKYLAYVNLSN